MKRILIVVALGLGVSFAAHAEEVLTAAAVSAEDQAVEQQMVDQQKSFFESRSLDDIQQLVHVDLKQLETSPDASGVGAG